MKRFLTFMTVAIALTSCSKEAFQDEKMRDLEGTYHYAGRISNIQDAAFISQDILAMAGQSAVTKTGNGTWDFTFTLLEILDESRPDGINRYEMAFEIIWNPVCGYYLARDVRFLSGPKDPNIYFVDIKDNRILVYSDVAGCRYVKDR